MPMMAAGQDKPSEEIRTTTHYRMFLFLLEKHPGLCLDFKPLTFPHQNLVSLQHQSPAASYSLSGLLIFDLSSLS